MRKCRLQKSGYSFIVKLHILVLIMSISHSLRKEHNVTVKKRGLKFMIGVKIFKACDKLLYQKIIYFTTSAIVILLINCNKLC
jgi:hypothetical protein